MQSVTNYTCCSTLYGEKQFLTVAGYTYFCKIRVFCFKIKNKPTIIRVVMQKNIEQINNQDIGCLFKKVDEKLSQHVNTTLSTLGVTFSQLRVLNFVEESENHETTQKEIETFLEVSHPTTNGIIKRLEAKKLLTTQLTVKNGRMSKTVTITEKGKELCKSNVADRKSLEDNFKSWLNADEYETFKEILNKLYKRLS